nr:TolC family protein [Photobacterium sanctipauli]
MADSTPTAKQTSQSLAQLIQWAIDNDRGLQRIEYQANAQTDLGIANSQLMDPTLKMGVGGLPTDSFSFDDDPMTNISVGLMQQFGRGNTLALQQKQSNQQADSIRQSSGVRELDITKAITTAWIELAYLNQASLLMQENQALFKELANYLGTNYGLGNNQSQDLIQSELQISKIDEQLQANQQMQLKLKAQLTEWLGDKARLIQAHSYPQWQTLAQFLNTHPQDYYPALASHPAIKVTNAMIASSETGVEIANEAYQPQFGVEVMYAYRQANGMDGSPASDLVSTFVTMDIPLFTEKRQDKKVSAAQYQVGAARTQRDLVLQQMNSQVNASVVDRDNTQQRLSRYQQVLLKHAQEKANAVERGYQNNTNQLDEYIKAASDVLTIKLEQARLEADVQQANNTLSYLLNKY